MKLLMPVEVAVNQITEVRDGEFSIGGATIKWTGDAPSVGDYFVTGDGVYEVWPKQYFDDNRNQMAEDLGWGLTPEEEGWQEPYRELRALDREGALDYLDGGIPNQYRLIKDTGWTDEGKQDVRSICLFHEGGAFFILSYSREGDPWSGYEITFDGMNLGKATPTITYEFNEYPSLDSKRPLCKSPQSPE